MYSPTYLELKTNLEQELDLQDETFITPAEFLNYFNEAVDMVEAAIHTIYEDYFLVSTPLTFASGTATYVLPTDIYAQKIRGLYYNDGSTNIYEVKRIKKLSDTNWLNLSSTNSLQYLITNDATNGLRIAFYPTPTASGAFGTIWYIRNAKRFSANADVCDIPEFTAVIVQYVRWKCMSKEGHPDTGSAAGALQAMKQDMIETLTARVPDEDNKIPMDLSFYDDFDSNGGYF